MPFIVGRAAREHELYERLKSFVTGVGFVGQAYYSGAGTGKLIDHRLAALAQSGDSYTLTCESVAARGGSFAVVSSVRGVLPDAEVNKVYADQGVQFYLDFGPVDFQLGDSFQLKFAEYSAAGKPKLTSVAARIGTLTEIITLTCTTAGTPTVAGVQVGTPAVFSVVGSVSGAHGDCVQGQSTVNSAISLTVGMGVPENAGTQYALGDTIVIHTTRNPLRATNQQWSTLRATQGAPLIQFGAVIPANDQELILKGPGLSGADEIVVGLRRSWNNPGGSAAWELAGLRGFAPGLTFDEQPGILPSARRPNLCTWSGEIPYWISVTGRKITVKIRNNTYYMDMYMGLGLPWGSPKYQPYFLCIGGSAGDQEASWTNLSVDNSNYWAPMSGTFDRSPMQVLNRQGAWQGHLARANNSRGDSYYGGGWINSDQPNVWPYRGNGMQKVMGNLDGTTPLLPVTLAPTMGELEGIVAVSGFGNIQPEDIIWQASTGRKFVAGTNTYRNSVEDFSAMELI